MNVTYRLLHQIIQENKLLLLKSNRSTHSDDSAFSRNLAQRLLSTLQARPLRTQNDQSFNPKTIPFLVSPHRSQKSADFPETTRPIASLKAAVNSNCNNKNQFQTVRVRDLSLHPMHLEVIKATI